MLQLQLHAPAAFNTSTERLHTAYKLSVMEPVLVGVSSMFRMFRNAIISMPFALGPAHHRTQPHAWHMTETHAPAVLTCELGVLQDCTELALQNLHAAHEIWHATTCKLVGSKQLSWPAKVLHEAEQAWLRHEDSEMNADAVATTEVTVVCYGFARCMYLCRCPPAKACCLHLHATPSCKNLLDGCISLPVAGTICVLVLVVCVRARYLHGSCAGSFVAGGGHPSRDENLSYQGCVCSSPHAYQLPSYRLFSSCHSGPWLCSICLQQCSGTM